MQRFTHVPAWQAHSVNYNPKSICHSDNPNAGQYSEETQRCHYQKKQIAPWDLRFIAFSDASFASKAKPESYAGMIILATHKDIAQNKSCVINPLYWGTKKQKFSELWQARCLQKHLRYPPLYHSWSTDLDTSVLGMVAQPSHSLAKTQKPFILFLKQ